MGIDPVLGEETLSKLFASLLKRDQLQKERLCSQKSFPSRVDPFQKGLGVQ